MHTNSVEKLPHTASACATEEGQTLPGSQTSGQFRACSAKGSNFTALGGGKGSLGGRGYNSDEHGFRKRNAALHLVKTRQMVTWDRSNTTSDTSHRHKGHFLLRVHRHVRRREYRDPPALELSGGGESTGHPSTRGVIPVSRARQEGCPAAWLKCSSAAAQAALVPANVCLTKENDTIS